MHSNPNEREVDMYLPDTALLSTIAFRFVGLKPACTSEASRALFIAASEASRDSHEQEFFKSAARVGNITSNQTIAQLGLSLGVMKKLRW